MFEERLNRIMRALDVNNDSELARKLGIKPPSVASARKRLQIPTGWIENVSVLANVSTDWLFFGRGPMHPGEEQPIIALQREHTQPSETTSTQCARCEKLEGKLERVEAKLERVEGQRDELADENRRLLKENGLLREENATLRERQRKEQASPFDERRHIPSSDDVLQNRPPVCK